MCCNQKDFVWYFLENDWNQIGPRKLPGKAGDSNC